ncbi:MAG: apolipoprotein N-acyltransferase [Candidatus Eisenbacteria bacterium]|nr:apolipoprotein N-acyltransferase [Candidatus Eisenbacteria bacterium]
MLQPAFFLLVFAVLLSLTFFPSGLGFLSFVALVPLFKAILQGATAGGEGRWKALKRGFFLGWLGGVMFFGITFYWIPLLPGENVTVPFIMFPAYLVMVGYLALYLGVFGALLRLTYVQVTRKVVLLAPCLWVLVELLRARGALGFPWASLGYSLWQYPSLIQIASVGSVYAVSLILVVVNALLYDAVARRIKPVVAVPAALAIVVLMLLFGQVAIHSNPPARELTVGLVQPNMASGIKWDPRFRQHNLDVLLELTEQLASQNPDFIVWPETAAPFHLRYEPTYMNLLTRTIDRVRVPLFLGFPDAVPQEDGELVYYNSAGLMMPGLGLVKKYDKVHLVPFGERIPYDDVFAFLKRVDFGEADFGVGKERTVFSLNGEKFSVLICFESIFPELVRSFKAEGADFLVNITNDEWFGRSAAPYQHAYMAVFRAVETRSSIARCANTGISMLIDPWGRITLRSGLFTREALVGKIKIVSSETFFTKHGFLVLWPFVGIAILECVLALVGGRKLKAKRLPI